MGVTSSTAQKSPDKKTHTRRNERRLDRFITDLLLDVADVLLDFFLDVAEPLLSDRTIFLGQILDLAAEFVNFHLPLVCGIIRRRVDIVNGFLSHGGVPFSSRTQSSGPVSPAFHTDNAGETQAFP